MNSSTTFCENCRKDVFYHTNDVAETQSFKGDDVEFVATIAHCEQCGDPVFVSEYLDANLKALYDAYRLKNNIISLERILEIPVKYDIGKRPLSTLLGWGELTFTRYCDGDMPSKQYADVLWRVYSEPVYYLSVLDDKKDIMKPSTYQKSRRATLKLLGELTACESKLSCAVKYILSECNDITNLALQKSLYYVQGFYRAFHDVFLFEDDCEAWVHGPVYKEIYHRYSGYGFGAINSTDSEIEFDDASFSTDEKTLTDSVIKYLCCYSGRTLEKFTHVETPWLKTRGDLLPNEPSARAIAKELIGSYFTAVKDKYNMLTPADIKSYSTAMFDSV